VSIESVAPDAQTPDEPTIVDDVANTAVGAVNDETIAIPPDDAITQLRELAWSAEEAPTVYTPCWHAPKERRQWDDGEHSSN
jgi:hypothetical protein